MSVVYEGRVDYPGNVGENEFGTSLDPNSSGFGISAFNRGPVAQLGARFHGMEEVVGSIPTRSTNFPLNLISVFVRRLHTALGLSFSPRPLRRGDMV